MSTAPVLAVYNENIPTKNIVPDPRWFDGDRTKFKDCVEESDYSSRTTE